MGVVLSDSVAVIAENFLVNRYGNKFIVERNFVELSDLYISPCPSSYPGIYLAPGLSELNIWLLPDVKQECVSLPLHTSNKFAVFPLVHTH